MRLLGETPWPHCSRVRVSARAALIAREGGQPLVRGSRSGYHLAWWGRDHRRVSPDRDIRQLSFGVLATLVLGVLSVTNFSSRACVRALALGGIAAALAAWVAIAASAFAATPVACKGISFSVLHNDSSGGVILPGGKYTVSSPNLGCKTASNYFTTFLNRYNQAIPGWKGKVIAKGWGTYTKNNSSAQFTVKWSKASAPQLRGCATASLKVSLGPANGTAGTTFYPLEFVNQSKTTCTLRVYPPVSAVTSSGTQIGNAASRVTSKFGTVALAPGTTHTASIGILETGNFSPSRCAPVTAAGLKVVPPSAVKSVTIKKRFSTCSSTTTTSLRVTAIR